MFSPYVSDSATARVADVLRNCWIGSGRLVDEFEMAVAERLGTTHSCPN
jgi:dTDP-4-amino-4,6-dideoxygalactose transaminase